LDNGQNFTGVSDGLFHGVDVESTLGDAEVQSGQARVTVR
jgi:hypothetical protein